MKEENIPHIFLNEKNQETPPPPNNQPPSGPPPSNDADVANNIKEFGQLSAPGKGTQSDIHCLTIIGQVEGHMSLPPQNKTTKYEHLIPQIVGICEDPKIKGVLIILNTVGGDVEAGLALAELISSINKPTVSLVLGGAHSIGVPISVASDYSFITPTASMTIHPVRMNGTVIGVSQSFEFFHQMQERIVAFVERNSNISGDRFRELMLAVGKLAMDVGTVLVGKQAVDEKLIDEMGGLKEAMQKLNELIKENDEKQGESL
ncbi:MAG: ATP-dependent Clp protease proteolytic subunit [Cellulosilyticum sp.]|nr:ATP-dependent Clp protease proteolytic subunit [Cellulosilyticum sp.]